MAVRPRIRFAAPFVVVIGCGSAQRPPDKPDVPGKKWTVTQYGGECHADEPMTACPKGALCNPPPPRPIECPEGFTEGSRIRVVKRPDATCGIIPENCIELACVVQTISCPTE